MRHKEKSDKIGWAQNLLPDSKCPNVIKWVSIGFFNLGENFAKKIGLREYELVRLAMMAIEFDLRPNSGLLQRPGRGALRSEWFCLCTSAPRANNPQRKNQGKREAFFAGGRLGRLNPFPNSAIWSLNGRQKLCIFGRVGHYKCEEGRKESAVGNNQHWETFFAPCLMNTHTGKRCGRKVEKI